MNLQATKNYNLNLGPQHPSAHGVLRLIIELSGEQIRKITPHIGLLHRGTEKLMEQRNVLQNLPYFDRLDYVSMIANEHLWCLSIEISCQTSIPLRGQYIRILFSELTRILNHLMALTTHAMDVGALTPFLWGFEEREKLMEFYERASGARMHASFVRVGGVSQDLPVGLLNDIFIFLKQFSSRIREIFELLWENRIWKIRLKNIGIISKKDAENFSFSGVLLRSSGICFDLRTNRPYEIYTNLNFITFLGKNSDSYDRFVQRMCEMDESVIISLQILDQICGGPVKTENEKLISSSRIQMKTTMENLINHFKLYSQGFRIPESEFYVSLEAPKGEFGVYILSNGMPNIYRCKIRAPGFFHLQSINKMAKGLNIADVVTIVGSQDIVFGEVDR